MPAVLPEPLRRPAPEAGAVPARARVVGVDIARGLALLGMFIAHAAPDLPGDAPRILAFFLDLPDERSRLLFAVTAGLGLGLLTGGTRPPARGALDLHGRSRRGVLRRQLAIRSVFLIALGFLLTATGVLIAVILDEYGVAFLVMLPLVFLPPTAMLVSGILLVVVVPGAAAALALHPALVIAANPPVGTGADAYALAQLADWFVTGAYPIGVWVGVMLIGVALVRFGLNRPVVVFAAFGIGAVAMVAGIGAAMPFGATGIRAPLPGDDPWGYAIGTSLFTVGNTGFGVALTMALIALTSLSAPAIARLSTLVASPVAAAGSMPLTVYTVQVLVLVATTAPGPDGVPTDDSWATLIWLCVGTLAGAWLWRRFIGRGPLEWLVGLLSGRVAWPGGRRGRGQDAVAGFGGAVRPGGSFGPSGSDAAPGPGGASGSPSDGPLGGPPGGAGSGR